jgi:hypothetical protein
MTGAEESSSLSGSSSPAGSSPPSDPPTPPQAPGSARACATGQVQGPNDPAERRLVRWAACAALLPIPLAFIISAVLAPAAAWRAEYRASIDGSGTRAVLFERELQRYWDKQNPRVTAAIDARSFSARWDTCVTVDTARNIPFMLVTDGTASFRIDGTERLSAMSSRARVTRGDVLRLEAGTHHLEVTLLPRGWPSVALLASFDDRPPRPLGTGRLAAGVRSFAPDDGAEPCPAR